MNERKPRFKIDVNQTGFTNWPVALFFRKRRWFGDRWEKINSFESIAKAREHYETLKDLPEYLA